MLESRLRFRFWVVAGVYAFFGFVFTWLSSHYFLVVNKNPIAFFIIISVIFGYTGGYIWLSGDYFKSVFGYYPWRKKPDHDDEWMGELHD
jgi:hypothetical protein